MRDLCEGDQREHWVAWDAGGCWQQGLHMEIVLGLVLSKGVVKANPLFSSVFSVLVMRLRAECYKITVVIFVR